MELLSAVLCDFAADYQGKLCILGAFDTVAATHFPIIHPQCSVAVRLLCRESDVGKHSLRITPINPDGALILPGGAPCWDFQIARIPQETFFLSQNFVLNFQNLRLEKPAQYAFDVSLDGSIIASIPLQAVQTRPKS